MNNRGCNPRQRQENSLVTPEGLNNELNIPV